MKERPHNFWWILLFLFIAASAAFWVYYNALSNGFIWDDPIVLERQVTAFFSARDIFFPPAGIPEFGGNYYRPLVVLSFIIDKAIWGKSPFGFHLTVVLFHILNTILVFFLARIILKRFEYRDIGAFISSLVFAVHPIHTESVDWIAGRSDVLAALFFFPALLFYLKYKEKDQRYWLVLSSLVFLFACLAKETSLSLILLLPVIDIAFFSDKAPQGEIARHERRRVERAEKKKRVEWKIREDKKSRKGEKRKKEEKRKKGEKGRKEAEEELSKKRKPFREWYHAINVVSYFPFAFAAVIYFIVRHFALGGEAKKVLQTGDFLGTLQNLINSYGFYIERIFLPVNLNAFIPEVPSGILATIFSIIVLSILIACIIYSFLRKKGIILFSILFFIFTLIPSIMVAVFQIAEIPLAERYLYIPSFSFSIILGFAFLYVPMKLKESANKKSMNEESTSKKSANKKSTEKELTRIAAPSQLIILFIILILVSLYSIQTIKRNTVWRNDLLFWEDVVEKVSDHGLPHLNLGLAYAQNKRPEDAEREYKKAIESKSNDETRSLTFNSLGALYLNEGDYDRAEECFTTAISLRRHYALPYYNMAVSLWKQYLKTNREGKLQKEAKKRDESEKQEDKLLERSIKFLDPAIQMNPRYARAHNLYGKILVELGRYDEARKHIETVLKYEKEGKVARSAKKLLGKIAAHNGE